MLSAHTKRLLRGRGRILPFSRLPREAKFAVMQYIVVDSYGKAWPDVADELYESAHFDQMSRTWKDNRTKRRIPTERVFGAALPLAEKLYGSKARFGFVRLPMRDITASIMQDEDIKNDYESFDEYHHDYATNIARQGGGNMPEHRVSKSWPVILSGPGDDVETLQDGWHRLHDYYRRGVKMVPCIYFP